MTESGICPVCENEIPEDSRFICPHCKFELMWVEDDRVIERAKQSVSGELHKPEKTRKKPNRNMGISEFFFGMLIDSIFELFWNFLWNAFD